MSSRKRKNPNPSETLSTPSKRTRLHRASSQDPIKSNSSGPACKYGSSRSAFAINRILDESVDKYLIDWAPGLAGTTWPSDWQPKKNANVAAVRLWEIEKSSKNEGIFWKQPRLTLTRKGAEETQYQRDSTRTLTPPASPTNGSSQLEAAGTQDHKVPSEQSQQSVQVISSSLDISNFPHVAVQVEPRESLDEAAYIPFSSSLTLLETQKSADTYSDSGFEESSSRQISPLSAGRDNEQSIIVPDSQSVPDSSIHFTAANSSGRSSKSPLTSEPSKPVGSSASITIPATQPTKGTTERSGSEPATSLGVIFKSPSTGFTSPSLLQTVSDPETLRGIGRAHHFVPRQRPNSRVVIDSPSPSSTSPPIHQPDLLLQSIEPSEDITQVQIPGSESHLAFEENRGIEGSVHSPVFITQVPLQFRESTTPTSSKSPINNTHILFDSQLTTSDTHQAGQIVPAAEKPTSELSSDSLPQAKALSELFQNSEDPKAGVSVSENSVEPLGPSAASTVDESDLAQRSETQSATLQRIQHAEVTDLAEQQATKSESIRRQQEPSDFSDLPHHQLPDTIDSRQPPEPPTSSNIAMSEIAQVGGAGDPPTESRLDKMRRKLQDVEAASDAKLAAQKAERQQLMNSSAPSSALPRRTEFEVKTNPVIALQSPGGPKSPSLARVAVTPKGPLSPAALESPPRIEHTSPLSVKSPAKIPFQEPYTPQVEPSFLGVDPTEMAKDLPAPIAASQRASSSLPVPSQRGGESIVDDATSTRSELQTTKLDVQKLGPGEFIIPLSMPPRTQKQYIDTYRFFQRKISMFGEGQDVSRDIVEDLNVMLDRVAKVTNHMDLDGGGPNSQDEVDVVGEAGYAVSVSEKFKFLACFLTVARDLDLRIAIVARSGQLCDFIETTLKSHEITYARWIHPRENLARSVSYDSRLRITLLPTGMDETEAGPVDHKVDLVIAFDETFDAQYSWVKLLRGQTASQAPVVPVIRLVVYATLEHIHLCLPTTLEPSDRLRKLLYYMVHAERAVGQLTSESLRQSPFDPSRCAEQVVDFVHAGAISGTWTLPSMPAIDDLPLLDMDSNVSDARSEFSSSLKSEGTLQYWPNHKVAKSSPSARIAGEKRPLDLEYGDSLELQTKKMRMGILASKGRPTEPIQALQDIREIEYIKNLEEQLQSAKASNYEPNSPMSWQSRVNIFDQANRERRELRTTVATLSTTVEKLTLNLAASKEEVATTKTALDEANASHDLLCYALRDEVRPDVQQMDVARRRLEEHQAIAAKVKKLANTESDLAFTRKVYQEASTAASSAASELDSLRPRLEDAEAKLAAAQQVQSKAREQERLSLQPLLKEKAALRETLKQRDKELHAIKLELDSLKRGRQGVQTRGSSMQPVGARSPRGSRGVSPAVAGLAPGSHGPGHQGGVAMARGPSGLGYNSRLGGNALDGGKMR